MDGSSGDPRVDGALARLAELNEAPLSGHPAIFEDVHHRLQDALAATDDAATDGAATDGAATDGAGTDEAWP